MTRIFSSSKRKKNFGKIGEKNYWWWWWLARGYYCWFRQISKWIERINKKKKNDQQKKELQGIFPEKFPIGNSRFSFAKFSVFLVYFTFILFFNFFFPLPKIKSINQKKKKKSTPNDQRHNHKMGNIVLILLPSWYYYYGRPTESMIKIN